MPTGRSFTPSTCIKRYANIWASRIVPVRIGSHLAAPRTLRSSHDAELPAPRTRSSAVNLLVPIFVALGGHSLPRIRQMSWWYSRRHVRPVLNEYAGTFGKYLTETLCQQLFADRGIGCLEIRERAHLRTGIVPVTAWSPYRARPGFHAQTTVAGLHHGRPRRLARR